MEPIIPNRAAGILLPVASLPGAYGCGGFGEEALRFIDKLAEWGVSYWQILPITYSYSHLCPYLNSSSQAKHHLYIDPQAMIREGLLMPEDAVPAASFSAERISDKVLPWKHMLLHKAYSSFLNGTAEFPESEFRKYVKREFSWLYDFSLYKVISSHFAHIPWQSWPDGLATRESLILAEWEERMSEAIEEEMFAQFMLDRQWQVVREYAHSKGIKIIGDVPMYSTDNSEDVWLHQQYYSLRPDGYPDRVGGYPPYEGFPQGQVWDTPTYRWDRLQDDGYALVIERLKAQMRSVDILRIDHYMGYFTYWSIPHGEASEKGSWMEGPGRRLFEFLKSLELPLVMEDLGMSNEEAEDVIAWYGSLGMRLLQADLDYGNPSQSYPERCIAYTGTHDNPPMNGWLKGLSESKQAEVEQWLDGICPAELARELRWAYPVLMSPAILAILPLQDILGMGEEARLNIPGTDAAENWTWRVDWLDIPDTLMGEFAQLVNKSGRNVVTS